MSIKNTQPTKEQLEAIVRQEQVERTADCEKVIQKALKKYNCTMHVRAILDVNQTSFQVVVTAL
jgi:hypothetical protein